MKYQIIISRKKGVMGGNWCIDGTRLPLTHLVNFICENDWTIAEYKRSFPSAKGKIVKS